MCGGGGGGWGGLQYRVVKFNDTVTYVCSLFFRCTCVAQKWKQRNVIFIITWNKVFTLELRKFVFLQFLVDKFAIEAECQQYEVFCLSHMREEFSQFDFTIILNTSRGAPDRAFLLPNQILNMPDS